MSPDPLQRPNRPQQPTPPVQQPTPNRNQPAPARPQKNNNNQGSRANGGGGNNHGHGGGGNDRNKQPSPWLDHLDPKLKPDKSASFVEYLRWMRSPDSAYKDPTKVQILQKAESANYRDRLITLTNRTKLIAGEKNSFQVECPWRLRVGGHRGPESILLPAFDALGMPYIPSSTLRGVARAEAIRDFMAKEGLKSKDAEKRVAPYFGSLDAEGGDRMGKVIFLDAYPLPGRDQGGGVSVDMANNIWNWKDSSLEYSPNPNPFLSLKESTLVIGIRPTAYCNQETLQQVRKWLIAGLQSGVGSQVNTGYGQLQRAGNNQTLDEFFRLGFSLEGQLIHGRQKFNDVNQPYQKDRNGNFRTDRNGKLKTNTSPEAEVRPVAFKSMLRYWLRTFALGVMPPSEVKRLEAKLFGSITLQQRGWVAVRIVDGKIDQPEARSKNDDPGKQSGTLLFNYSTEAPESAKKAVKDLFANLAWMMFHLGGIGQGARRPCYSRKNGDRAPWWRGSTFTPQSDEDFWALPYKVQGLQGLFRQRLKGFYEALSKLTERNINPRSPLSVGQVRRDQWQEAVDARCQIVVCSGAEDFNKPYALATLHSRDLKTQNRRGQWDYDPELCGKVLGGVKPSPVWIADLDDFQVVTVFGATQDPRKRYLQELRDRTSSENYAQVWPLA